MNATIHIKVRDRIGLVNEITGIIKNLGIGVVKHGAVVTMDRSGCPVSSFRAVLDIGDSAEFQLLTKRMRRIKGLISIESN